MGLFVQLHSSAPAYSSILGLLSLSTSLALSTSSLELEEPAISWEQIYTFLFFALLYPSLHKHAHQAFFFFCKDFLTRYLLGF